MMKIPIVKWEPQKSSIMDIPSFSVGRERKNKEVKRKKEGHKC